MPRTRFAILTLAGGCTALGAFSIAAAEPEALAGPRVEAGEKPATLVERNLDGSMKRPDAPIAEAALERLELDEATRVKVDLFLAERAGVIDSIVKQNLETLNTMRTDREARGPEVRREHAQRLTELFKPVLEKGPLEAQIAALLPEAQREPYLGMIREHREAMIAERVRNARGPRGEGPGSGEGRGPRGGPGMDDPMLFDDETPPPPRPRPEGRGEGRPEFAPGSPAAERRAMAMQLDTLRFEIQRSVERVTGERRDRMDSIVRELDLTPEQEAKVTALLRQRGEAMRNDDPAARREIMRAIAEELTPEQREKFRELVGPPDRGQRPARRARPQPSDD
jgi:Spy/CpxP family protein refolding chaperone